MEQNDFYEVDGCIDFIPVTINETYADAVGVTAHESIYPRGLSVKHVYRFPKVHEQQKTVVPRMILDTIESFDEDIDNLHDYISRQPFEVKMWIAQNERDFYKAWLAYPNITVEQEKLYTVEIEGVSSGKLFKNIRTNKYLFHSGKGLKGYTDRLTETEIKQKDERLWQFVKEVEDK